MKRLFLVIVLAFGGCNNNLYNVEREAAVKACEQNGGVEYISVWPFLPGVDVKCKNGAKFKKVDIGGVAK